MTIQLEAYQVFLILSAVLSAVAGMIKMMGSQINKNIQQNFESTNQKIEEQTTSKFWKGDFEVFGTNGTDEGKILLPNYLIKTTWFPTNTAIQQHPFELVIESENQKYQINYINKTLKIKSL